MYADIEDHKSYEAVLTVSPYGWQASQKSNEKKSILYWQNVSPWRTKQRASPWWTTPIFQCSSNKWTSAACFCWARPLHFQYGLNTMRTNHFVLPNALSLSFSRTFCHTEQTDMRCSVHRGLLLYFADGRKKAVSALREGLAYFSFIFPRSLSHTLNLHINLPSRSNMLSHERRSSSWQLPAFCPADHILWLLKE